MGNTGSDSSFKEQSSNSFRNIFLALSTSVRKYYMSELLVFNMSKIHSCFKEKVHSCDI